MSPSAIVIGAGFSGLSAAASLAKKGYAVTVLEKNAEPGGRARVLHEQGFTFDMGPSWYWMPEIFEQWFASFGSSVKDHYDLKRLDPSYQVIFSRSDRWNLPASMNDLKALFERIEAGAGENLERFLAEAKIKYDLGMADLVRGPALSWFEYTKPRVIKGLLSTTVFRSMRDHVADSFADPRLRMLLEFPVLFLGAAPDRTPALYSLMNYADMSLGTWYPLGGMGRIIEAMVQVAKEQGVGFRMGSPVTRILVEHGNAIGVQVGGTALYADVVVASADYHHVDNDLLSSKERNYSEVYWNERVMAPSSLLFYCGFNTRLGGLEHHNLFFDRSLDRHAHEIYTDPQWPSKPLMYVCAPSITDPSVAPAGHENLFVLIPIAAGLTDTPEVRSRYRQEVLDRLNVRCGTDVVQHLVFERSYCINDFKADYNAFRGNAYGLANTLRQTAVLKPSMKNRHVRSLYYTGQLTVPGPGVPPSLISGQVVADLIEKEMAPKRQRA